ncbi:hypothetical protein, partial [Thiolapillus sp.]
TPCLISGTFIIHTIADMQAGRKTSQNPAILCGSAICEKITRFCPDHSVYNQGVAGRGSNSWSC